MVNSRQKGARGEREWAGFLKDSGYDARRGQQYQGGPGIPDVICDALPIHWEVKRVERLNITNAYKQSKRDSADTEIPAVAHRRNGETWLVTVSAKDFFELMTGDDTDGHLW